MLISFGAAVVFCTVVRVVLCVVLCVVLGLGTLLPMAIVVEVEAVLFQLTKALLRMYIRNDRKNLRFSATLNHNCVLIDCEIYRK